MRNDIIRKAATPGDVYLNPVLANVSIAAFQDTSEFVARSVFPTIEGGDHGTYYIIDTDGIAQNKAAKRAPGDEANEGSWDITKDTFTVEQLGYKEKVPEELQRSTGAAARAEDVSTKSVAEVMLIASEADWATRFFQTGKWGRDMAGASSSVADVSFKYWSSSGSTPIPDFLAERTRMKLKGKRFPNTVILGKYVEDYLLTHPDIVARVNAGQTPGQAADPTLNDLAKFFKVQRVLVASAVYNTSKNATASNSFILDPKSLWMGYVNPTPAVQMPSAGYRFTDSVLAGNSEGVRNWKYWWQPNRSTYVEGALDDTYKLVSANLGTFLAGITQ